MTTRATAKTTKPARGAKAVQRAPADDRDAEARALWASPVFQALLAEAREATSEDLISPEELDRRLGPMTAAQKAHADAYLVALERLEREQGGDVTDVQGRLLELVLTAADHVREEATLPQLAEDSGFPEEEIRAVAAGLRAAGLAVARGAVRRE
ncbi:MAG TPA: hypothetical protein VG370_20205 [Chloroflexota bacterium]|jgi:hypothetical protein|nr:hypothetical protein [Chloroflexota bacterium]